MAKSEFVTFTPYDQQMAELQRRQRMADLLQQQALEPVQAPEGGRFVVPVSPLAPLAKMLQGYIGGRMERDITRRRGEAEQQARQEAETYLRGFQPSMQVSPQAALDASLTPMDQVANVQPQAVSLTPQERQTRILSGVSSANPYTRAMAGALSQMKPETEEYYDAVPVTIDGVTQMVQYSKTGGAPRMLAGQKYEKPTTPAPLSEYQRQELELRKREQQFRETKAGQALERPKAPSGFRYTSSGDLEPIPGGPNDPNAVKNMPASMISANIADTAEIKRFGDNKSLLGGFISDIDSGKLPLGKGTNLKYEGEQAVSGLNIGGVGFGSASPEAVRYFELKRAVTEQVNSILSLAKGPQTDQDAIRARDQILSNLNDPKIVASGLRRLQEIFDRESTIREDSIAERNQAYGRGGVPAPPPGFKRQ